MESLHQTASPSPPRRSRGVHLRPCREAHRPTTPAPARSTGRRRWRLCRLRGKDGRWGMGWHPDGVGRQEVKLGTRTRFTPPVVVGCGRGQVDAERGGERACELCQPTPPGRVVSSPTATLLLLALSPPSMSLFWRWSLGCRELSTRVGTGGREKSRRFREGERGSGLRLFLSIVKPF